MNRFKQVCIALATAVMLGSGVAQAALFDRGGGLIYDDVLDITWLSDANYAQTSGYDVDGRMSWAAANSWAANLVYGGFDDWRLPTALNQDGSGPCTQFGCISSEMGHMFYNNLAASISGFMPNTANLALFTNLQRSNHWIYWSGTPWAPSPANGAWTFDYRFGDQGIDNQGSQHFAWAVRSGDVITPIPEPGMYALLLAGLGLLGAVAKRRQRSFGAS